MIHVPLLMAKALEWLGILTDRFNFAFNRIRSSNANPWLSQIAVARRYAPSSNGGSTGRADREVGVGRYESQRMKIEVSRRFARFS